MEVDKITTDITYSLVLHSNDRIAGTHNNPTFNIEWDNFLPPDIADYKVCYTFQSTSGFYCDSFYQKNPLTPTVGVTETISSDWTKPNSIGANLLIFGSATSVTVGNMVYGVGVPINSTIKGIASAGTSYAYMSSPLTANIVETSSLQIVNPTSVNAVGFSSARILANFGNKSYSYDTSIKGQSLKTQRSKCVNHCLWMTNPSYYASIMTYVRVADANRTNSNSTIPFP